jgi:hypothetical protein
MATPGVAREGVGDPARDSEPAGYRLAARVEVDVDP